MAYDDAARFLEAALAIAPDGRVDLLLRLADATMRAGDVARAKERCLEAHDLAQRTGDAARPDRRRARRTARRRGATPARARPRPGCCAACSPWPTTRSTRVRLQASLTRALAFSGDGEAAAVLGEDALASARALGDPYALRLAFEAAVVRPVDAAERCARQLAVMRESAEVARATRRPGVGERRRREALYGEITAGDLTPRGPRRVRHRELAANVGQPLFRALDCQAHALLAMGEGRFAEAEVLAAEADALGRLVDRRARRAGTASSCSASGASRGGSTRPVRSSRPWPGWAGRRRRGGRRWR